MLLPHEDSLNELNSQLIFLKAYQLASADGRFLFSIAQSLVEEAKHALAETTQRAEKPVLLQSLEQKVRTIIEQLEVLIDSTKQQLQDCHIDINTR